MKKTRGRRQGKDDIRKDLVHFLEANEQCSTKISQGMTTNPPVLRSGSVVRSLFSNNSSNKVRITNDDIQDEVDFWKPSIACYVLGANPPLVVIEGFVRRMWLDKIEREPSINVKKEDIKMVPIWVHLDELDLKYWGEKSLYKIIRQIGKPVVVDEATKRREKLNFSRVLIEVAIKQDLPELIEFEDENGCNTTVAISYEWKPVICANCNGMRHATNDFRKKEPRQK
uniref:DUF4283 domain-containing protein n=1 Tax=Cannabis sativa TaxID=3483 RepID=A0A803PAH1_CANSA